MAPEATKVDLKNALKKFYDVEIQSVRVLRVRPKTRVISGSRTMTKRKRAKRMIVTLAPKSKPLDVSTFKA